MSQEVVEMVLKDTMIREVNKRFWMTRKKLNSPVLRTWRWETTNVSVRSGNICTFSLY